MLDVRVLSLPGGDEEEAASLLELRRMLAGGLVMGSIMPCRAEEKSNCHDSFEGCNGEDIVDGLGAITAI